MTPKLLLIISIILILDSIRSLQAVNEKNKFINKRLLDIFKRRPSIVVENKINDEEDTFFKEFPQNFLKMPTQNEHDHHIWKSLLNKWLRRDEEKQSKLKQKELSSFIMI